MLLVWPARQDTSADAEMAAADVYGAQVAHARRAGGTRLGIDRILDPGAARDELETSVGDERARGTCAIA